MRNCCGQQFVEMILNLHALILSELSYVLDYKHYRFLILEANPSLLKSDYDFVIYLITRTARTCNFKIRRSRLLDQVSPLSIYINYF